MRTRAHDSAKHLAVHAQQDREPACEMRMPGVRTKAGLAHNEQLEVAVAPLRFHARHAWHAQAHSVNCIPMHLSSNVFLPSPSCAAELHMGSAQQAHHVECHLLPTMALCPCLQGVGLLRTRAFMGVHT